MAQLIPIELRFHPHEPCYPCYIDHNAGAPAMGNQKPAAGARIPTYFVRGTFDYNGRTYEAVAYQIFYTANPADGCGNCCFPRADALGYHDWDCERITVLYDPKNLTPQWVYYGAHSRGQGVWVSWEAAPKTRDGALVAYVALNSHAMYPTPCTYLRIFGLANDYCSRRGVHVRINDYIPAHLFRTPNGIEVSDRIPNLGQGSITAWQRFFLPKYASYLRNVAP